MHAEIMEVLSGALDGERRDMFAADLEGYSPQELAAELRTVEQLLEGLCIASEGVGLLALLATNDCRERVRRAQEIAGQAARA